MSTLPLQDELQKAIDHDLWLLREAMAQEEPSLDPQGEYVVPARFYLPDMKEGLERWTDAKTHAFLAIPRGIQFQTKQLERLGTVSSVAEMAQIAPETRRYWLVDLVHHFMQQAIEILENEGRPPTPTPRNLQLGKMRAEGWSK